MVQDIETKAENRGRFKKGDPRINRKGRAKLGKTLAEKFRDALAEPLSEGYTKLDSVIDALIDKALHGNQEAIEYCLARGWGKLIDRTESINLNKNYDFTNLPLDERMKLLEQLKEANVDIASDNSDTQ